MSILRLAHFGKGRTGAVLEPPAGRHRLRRPCADHGHRPYVVFSPQIEFTVTGARNVNPLPIGRRHFEASCRAGYQDEPARPRPPGEPVTVRDLRDGACPLLLRFVDGRTRHDRLPACESTVPVDGQERL